MRYVSAKASATVLRGILINKARKGNLSENPGRWAKPRADRCDGKAGTGRAPSQCRLRALSLQHRGWRAH